MSELFVDTIRAVDGSPTVDVNGFVLSESNTGGRNLLHNGAMRVNQYNSGPFAFTDTTATAVDRWTADIDAAYTAGMRGTVGRVEEGPTGFSYSLKYEITTAIARESVTAGRIQLYQRLEGFDMAPMSYGDSTAREVTISFWAKTNVVGKYDVNVSGIVPGQNLYQYIAQYEVVEPDAWVRYAVTIPGCVVGVWEANTSGQIQMQFGCGVTSDLAAPVDEWVPLASAGNPSGSADSVWLGADVGNYWQVTGVQMELGPTATSYDYRRIADELNTCYRYYQRINCYSQTVYLASGIQYSATAGYLAMQLAAPMRTTPSLTISAAADFQVLNGAATNITALAITGTPSPTGCIGLTYTGAGTTGRGAVLRSDAGATVYMAYSAAI